MNQQYNTADDSLHNRLLGLYGLFPFQDHPLWLAIKQGELTKPQVLLAEGQHFLRTRAGQKVRKQALKESESIPELYSAIYQTYLEECTDETGTDNHLALIQRLLTENGVTISSLELYASPD